MPPPGAARNSGWHIEYQQPSTELGSDGKAVNGMRVAFVTGRGVHAYVFVPNSEYTVERVRDLISERVSIIDTVHALSGPAGA